MNSLHEGLELYAIRIGYKTILKETNYPIEKKMFIYQRLAEVEKEIYRLNHG